MLSHFIEPWVWVPIRYLSKWELNKIFLRVIITTENTKIQFLISNCNFIFQILNSSTICKIFFPCFTKRILCSHFYFNLKKNDYFEIDLKKMIIFQLYFKNIPAVPIFSRKLWGMGLWKTGPSNVRPKTKNPSLNEYVPEIIY